MPKFRGMSYKIYGQGKPILLLHGWGANGDSFAKIVHEFMLDYRVYVVDFWGFGDSEMPPAAATIYDYASVVADFITQVIGSHLIVLGHSFGGRVAMIIGNHDLIDAVVLVDSAGLRPRLGLIKKIKIKRYKNLRKKVNAGKIDASRLRGFGSSDYQTLDSVMRAVFVRVVNADLAQHAEVLQKPTLIVWGKQDKTTPLKSAKKLHKLITNSSLVMLPGGHFSFVDSPREFVDACSRFFIEIEMENKDV